jgi:hypothetical protein
LKTWCGKDAISLWLGLASRSISTAGTEGAVEKKELGVAENEDDDADRRGQGLLSISPMLSKWDSPFGWSRDEGRQGENSDIRAAPRL